MGRRTELWRSLFSFLLTILFVISIYFLLEHFVDNMPSTSENFQTVKKIFNFMKDLLLGICSMGILIQALRLMFSYLLYTNETNAPSSTYGVQEREVQQPNVADALEDFLSSSNHTVSTEVTPPQAEQDVIVQAQEQSSLGKSVARVIRVHDDSEYHDREPEDTFADGARRVIRS